MICWCCPGHGTLFLLLSFSWLTEYHCLWDMEHWTRSRGSDGDQSPHTECCGRTRESDSGWSHDAGRTSPPEPGSWRCHETLIWTPVLIWSLSRIYTRLLTMWLIAWVISFVAFWKRKFIDTCKIVLQILFGTKTKYYRQEIKAESRRELHRDALGDAVKILEAKEIIGMDTVNEYDWKKEALLNFSKINLLRIHNTVWNQIPCPRFTLIWVLKVVSQY